MSRSDGAPVIDARGLTRRFGELVAVDGVDLSVQRGEIFGCLGPNGSGKSTLMRMLLGLLAPSDGSARVLGREMPREAEQLRPVVGYMTQRFSLYEDLDVRENLEFAAEIFGLARRRRQERIASVLGRHGLDAYADARAGVLSGGFKQRLVLAAATIHEPELLVLDEPTAGVDPQSRRAFWEHLFELASAGTTVFVSTHYMDEAVRCHRLCILRDGRRAAVGTPRALALPLAERVVDVDAEPAEAAIAALGASPLVASTTQLGDSVHVLLREDAPPADESAARIARFLAEAGLPGARARPGAPQLEDVFVALLLGERPDGEERRLRPRPGSRGAALPGRDAVDGARHLLARAHPVPGHADGVLLLPALDAALGLHVPFEAMPRPAQWIGELLPLTHFLRVVRGILMKGAPIAALGAEVGAIVAFRVAALLLAIATFRKRLA